MKTIVNAVWQYLVMFGEARYAATLARQGRFEESQAVYNK